MHLFSGRRKYKTNIKIVIKSHLCNTKAKQLQHSWIYRSSPSFITISVEKYADEIRIEIFPESVISVVWRNGATYKGQWRNNLMHGSGKMCYSNRVDKGEQVSISPTFYTQLMQKNREVTWNVNFCKTNDIYFWCLVKTDFPFVLYSSKYN